MSQSEIAPSPAQYVDMDNFTVEDILSLSRATAMFGQGLQAENQMPDDTAELVIEAFRPVSRAAIRASIPKASYLPTLEEARLMPVMEGDIAPSDSIPGSALKRVLDEKYDVSTMLESRFISRDYLLFSARCVLRGVIQPKAKTERKAYAQALDALHEDPETRDIVAVAEARAAA